MRNLSPGTMSALLILGVIIFLSVGAAFVSPMLALGILVGGTVAMSCMALVMVGIMGRRG